MNMSLETDRHVYVKRILNIAFQDECLLCPHPLQPDGMLILPLPDRALKMDFWNAISQTAETAPQQNLALINLLTVWKTPSLIAIVEAIVHAFAKTLEQYNQFDPDIFASIMRSIGVALDLQKLVRPELSETAISTLDMLRNENLFNKLVNAENKLLRDRFRRLSSLSQIDPCYACVDITCAYFSNVYDYPPATKPDRIVWRTLDIAGGIEHMLFPVTEGLAHYIATHCAPVYQEHLKRFLGPQNCENRLRISGGWSFEAIREGLLPALNGLLAQAGQALVRIPTPEEAERVIQTMWRPEYRLLGLRLRSNATVLTLRPPQASSDLVSGSNLREAVIIPLDGFTYTQQDMYIGGPTFTTTLNPFSSYLSLGVRFVRDYA